MSDLDLLLKLIPDSVVDTLWIMAVFFLFCASVRPTARAAAFMRYHHPASCFRMAGAALSA